MNQQDRLALTPPNSIHSQHGSFSSVRFYAALERVFPPVGGRLVADPENALLRTDTAGSPSPGVLFLRTDRLLPYRTPLKSNLGMNSRARPQTCPPDPRDIPRPPSCVIHPSHGTCCMRI